MLEKLAHPTCAFDYLLNLDGVKPFSDKMNRTPMASQRPFTAKILIPIFINKKLIVD